MAARKNATIHNITDINYCRPEPTEEWYIKLMHK